MNTTSGNFREVVADDCRGGLERNPFTEAKHLKQRYCHKIGDNESHGDDEKPEEEGSYRDAKVSKIFQYNDDNVKYQKEGRRIEKSFQKPVFVVLANKSIKFIYYG